MAVLAGHDAGLKLVSYMAGRLLPPLAADRRSGYAFLDTGHRV
jgi:hypothetical protein